MRANTIDKKQPLCRRRMLLVLFGQLLFSLLLSGSVAAHTTNRGKATFAVGDDGAVAMRIDLELRDLQEILAIKLAVPTFWEPSDDSVRVEVFEKLRERTPKWTKIRGDDVTCPVAFVGLRKLGRRGATLRMRAQCERAPEALRIDWGLAKRTGFDLVAITLVTAPGSYRHTSVLSAKRPRLEVVLATPSTWDTGLRFLSLGFEHILLGWDHLLFLLALLLSVATWKRLVLVVSGFTLAHSLTLGLGAAGKINVDGAIIEPIIALSIAVVAAVGAYRLREGTLQHPGSPTSDVDERQRRGLRLGDFGMEFAFALLFGLVHGLGFATLLRQQLAASDSILVPLIGFNGGVELGQLLFCALVFPLLAWGGRSRFGPRAFYGLFAVLMAVGSYVAVTRLLSS